MSAVTGTCTARDPTHDVQHRVQRDRLAVVVAQGMGHRPTGSGDGGIAEPFQHPRASWVPDVRQHQDAVRVMQRAQPLGLLHQFAYFRASHCPFLLLRALEHA